MTGEGIGVEYLWALDELLEEARSLLRGVVIPEGCTVTVEADEAASAILFVGRRVEPQGAAVVMVDLDAVNDDGQRLPFALHDLLSRLESPLLPACAPGDVPPVELHIQKRQLKVPVRTLATLKRG